MMQIAESWLAESAEGRELIARFRVSMDASRVALDRAWHEADLAALQKIATHLKGTAASYGFPEVGAAAAELERALRAGFDLDAPLDRLLASIDRGAES